MILRKYNLKKTVNQRPFRVLVFLFVPGKNDTMLDDYPIILYTSTGKMLWLLIGKVEKFFPANYTKNHYNIRWNSPFARLKLDPYVLLCVLYSLVLGHH